MQQQSAAGRQAWPLCISYQPRMLCALWLVQHLCNRLHCQTWFAHSPNWQSLLLCYWPGSSCTAAGQASVPAARSTVQDSDHGACSPAGGCKAPCRSLRSCVADCCQPKRSARLAKMERDRVGPTRKEGSGTQHAKGTHHNAKAYLLCEPCERLRAGSGRMDVGLSQLFWRRRRRD
jgi:hypothetical protein